jgi:hypothetical protein
MAASRGPVLKERVEDFFWYYVSAHSIPLECKFGADGRVKSTREPRPRRPWRALPDRTGSAKEGPDEITDEE